MRFNVGRTGSINPYAVLDSVYVGGANVSRATLHNEDYIASKNLRIGDRVIVERAGEVIPQVVRPVIEERAGSETEVVMPSECPSCGEAIVRREDEAMSYCVNASCPEQLVRLGGALCEQGRDGHRGLGREMGGYPHLPGLVRDVADLYRLKKEDLAQMNLLDAIAAAKSNNFASVLDKVGIPNVGKKTAGILAGRYNSLEQLIADSKDGLSAIEGVSERAAHSVAAYFQDEDLLRAVEEIGSAFVGQSLIDSPTDLYYVNRKYLLDPKTLRQKSADNLLNAIEASKSRPLTRVLVALGIAHVGSEVAALLAAPLRFHGQVQTGEPGGDGRAELNRPQDC